MIRKLFVLLLICVGAQAQVMYPYVTKKASAGGGGGSPTPFYLANATMGTTVSGGTSMQITVSLPSGCNYLRVEMGEANEYSRCDSAYICSTTPDVIGARIGLKDAGGTNLNQESWGIQRSDTSAASVVVRIHMTASIDFAAGVVPVVKANSSAPAGTYNGQSSAGTTSPSFTVEAVSGDTIVVSTLEGNVTGGSVTNIGSVSDLSGYRSFTILKKAYVANPTTVSYATSNSPLNAGGAAVKP